MASLVYADAGLCALYAHLPLNIGSKSNFHIHAGFSLLSNRRQLCDDDWNKTLLMNEVPHAFVRVLEEMKGLQIKSKVIVEFECYFFTTLGFLDAKEFF